MGSTKSYTIITNGVINKHIYDDNILMKYLSEGWIKGKTQTVEQKASWKKSFLNTFNNKSEEEIKEWKNKNSSKNKDRYEKMSKADKEQRSLNISKGIQQMWDNMSEEDKILREEHRAVTRENWTEEEKQQNSKKMSESAKANRAIITPDEYHKRSIKATATKKENKTFAVSSFEDKTKDILYSKYGENDIIYDDYIDDRYSSKCDFYIKSLDIFIELNIHPSHGGHPFNIDDEKDLQLKELLEIKNDNWSNMILDVWCNRDVKKLNEAKINKLNYITVYSEDFNNFIEIIREGDIWSLVN